MSKLASYSTDKCACDIRDQCDYSIRISRQVAEDGTAQRPIRIIVDGVFDLFHIGELFQNVQLKQ